MACEETQVKDKAHHTCIRTLTRLSFKLESANFHLGSRVVCCLLAIVLGFPHDMLLLPHCILGRLSTTTRTVSNLGLPKGMTTRSLTWAWRGRTATDGETLRGRYPFECEIDDLTGLHAESCSSTSLCLAQQIKALFTKVRLLTLLLLLNQQFYPNGMCQGGTFRSLYVRESSCVFR